MKNIRVFAPATVANVGPAFDILGFAVSAPGDIVELALCDRPGVELVEIVGDQGRLPREVEKNTAAVAINALLKQLGSSAGFKLKLIKDMPLGSGMGSSAASAVAGVFAANQLLGQPFSTKELLPFAMQAEAVACGAAHADNVAPCLLGGFVLIKSYDPLDIIKLPTPSNLYCVLVHPNIEIKTADSRKVLKRNIPLETVVIQSGNLAGLIAALCLEDLPLLARSLHDAIIEPERSVLIPGFKQVKELALEAGALGCSISGSGPAMFALCDGSNVAEIVAHNMAQKFSSLGFKAETFVSLVNQQGPRILD